MVKISFILVFQSRSESGSTARIASVVDTFFIEDSSIKPNDIEGVTRLIRKALTKKCNYYSNSLLVSASHFLLPN